jgi:hypothetical protein
MSKMRSDSTWANLAEEHREKLEGWLFEEGLSYRETLERARKELGVEGTIASLGRFYRRLSRERTLDGWEQMKELASRTEQAGMKREELEETAMVLLAQRVALVAMESPERLRELGSLARALVAAQGTEIKRRRLALEEKKLAAAEPAEEPDWKL